MREIDPQSNEYEAMTAREAELNELAISALLDRNEADGHRETKKMFSRAGAALSGALVVDLMVTRGWGIEADVLMGLDILSFGAVVVQRARQHRAMSRFRQTQSQSAALLREGL